MPPRGLVLHLQYDAPTLRQCQERGHARLAVPGRAPVGHAAHAMHHPAAHHAALQDDLMVLGTREIGFGQGISRKRDVVLARRRRRCAVVEMGDRISKILVEIVADGITTSRLPL